MKQRVVRVRVPGYPQQPGRDSGSGPHGLEAETLLSLIVAWASARTPPKLGLMSPPLRHMLESHTVAEVGPGLHQLGRLWQFSSIIGRPVALISAAQSDMFIALPHWSIFTASNCMSFKNSTSS